MPYKKLGITLFEQELMNLQRESNKKEIENLNNVIKNRCRQCKTCILEKYYQRIKYDPTLAEWLPQQGDIWSKEYQCEEILKILEE